jgi:geranylgeranyl diphosphate synthase type I
VIKELTDKGVLADVRAVAQDLVETGNKHLSLLPPSKERELLMEIGGFFVTRSH